MAFVLNHVSFHFNYNPKQFHVLLCAGWNIDGWVKELTSVKRVCDTDADQYEAMFSSILALWVS